MKKRRSASSARSSRRATSRSARATSRSPRRIGLDMAALNTLVARIRSQHGHLIAGVVILLLAAFLGWSLADGNATPWLVQMVGWTAPITALALFLMGAVLLLPERLGYWSAEAIVGAELFLLSLQAGAFAWIHSSPDWIPRMDGSEGGLVGWGLGNILVAGLGQWPAAALLMLLGLAGWILLWRSTPLIYLVPLVKLAGPAIARLRAALAATYAHYRPSKSLQPPATLPDPSPLLAPREEDLHSASNVMSSEPVFAAPVAASPADPPADHPPKPRRPAKSRTNKAEVARPPRKPAQLPPLDLLNPDSGKYGNKNVEAMAQIIKNTLDDFNVPVDIIHVETGPTVTQYGVQPLYVERAGQRRKIRVSRIVNLSDDLALALAAPAVRIEAPVPGRPYVGIEVPNPEKNLVSMRSILENTDLKKAGLLPLALGRNTAGAPVLMDLTRAPHVLIAGATGSGKSACINAIIVSLLMQHSPENLQFVMVDPKMVELPGYNGIPHLIGKVITEMDQVVGALTWLLLQMDDRYQLFRQVGARNIGAYNRLAAKRKDLDPLPFIVLIVDELADLMMTAPEEIERQLCRLAQMARATGIHLALATQRPSTDVVTGLIKANFPTRIAFAVTSQIDSRVILDTPGAEKLLGQGDMLLMLPDKASLTRVQGAWVSDTEIERVVHFWKSQGEDRSSVAVPPWVGLLDRLEDEDELLQEAIDIIQGMETCSTSLLQRRLRIGYPKAARLMEQMEAKGVVGPDLGGGQGRQILLKEENDDASL